MSLLNYYDMLMCIGFHSGNLVLARKEFKERFPNKPVPSKKAFSGLVHRLLTTGSVLKVDTKEYLQKKTVVKAKKITVKKNELDKKKRKEKMGEEKEGSGFGFKDKSKALETLELLKEHDMNYRKLTIRGLLRNGKRVVSITKNEEKLKNLKEALEVFENWLEENGGGAKKNDLDVESGNNKEKSPVPDKVPGLGFKDPEAARETLKNLEGRDPDYQKLAINGLLKSAKRVLTCTKDKTKLENIKSAMKILEDFLEEFDKNNMSKENNPYLPLETVEFCLKIAHDRKLKISKQMEFLEAYRSVGGDYKKLRTVNKENEQTWDIVRNKALKPLKQKIKDATLFNDSDQPTDAHLELILWAYSPQDSKVKKLASGDDGGRKRKSNSDGEGGGKKSK